MNEITIVIIILGFLLFLSRPPSWTTLLGKALAKLLGAEPILTLEEAEARDPAPEPPDSLEESSATAGESDDEDELDPSDTPADEAGRVIAVRPRTESGTRRELNTSEK